LEIINLYRILRTSSHGVRCSLTQYNRIDSKTNAALVYRKEIFNDIIKHIRENPDINNIIIDGDYNQNIGDNNIRLFHKRLGVNNIHQIINNIPINYIGKIYIHRSNPIDSLAVSIGIIQYIDGCKILGYNEIAESDHKSYLVDISLEEYFQDELCE